MNMGINSKLTKLENLTANLKGDKPILTIIPSWGDTVIRNGVEIPRDQYKPSPNTKVINLTWGDND